MEIDRKSIHMRRTKGKEEVMITLDDDFMLPDTCPDIKQKIKDRGDVVIEKVRGMDEKISVSGYLKYELLYYGEKDCGSTQGKIYFEELMGMEGVSPQDIIKCTAKVEDLSIHIIHSRKISIKALIKIAVVADSISTADVVCKIQTDNIQCKNKKISTTNLISSQKDIYRIKESVTLPKTMDVPDKINWYEMEIEGMECRLREKDLELKGELVFFCIYSSNQESKPQFYNERIPFSGKISINAGSENSFPDINVNMSEKNITLKADGNGEVRLVDLEALLDLDIKVYEEDEWDVLLDAYSPNKGIKLDKEKIQCENMVLKNNMQCRVEDVKSLTDRDVMQLLNCTGSVHIEDVSEDSEGVVVEGGIVADLMYLRASEDESIGFARHKMPFSQRIDGIKNVSGYHFNCKEQSLKINGVLMNGEVSIKALVGIDIMVMETKEEECVLKVVEGEPDYKRMRELPGITGYITMEEDTLWEIAKRYGTTVSSIMETNNLVTEEIKPGMKILVVKSY